MTRIIAIVAAIAITVASSSSAMAGSRDLRGQAVQTESAALVFWSMDCGDCVEAIRSLQADGRRVVAVNTDPVQVRSQVIPHLAARGIDATVVQDADGSMQRRYGIDEGIVVVDADDRVAWTGTVDERPASSAVAAR